MLVRIIIIIMLVRIIMIRINRSRMIIYLLGMIVIIQDIIRRNKDQTYQQKAI